MEVILPHLGEIAYFGDDLGMQNAFAIGLRHWRKYMKPCFGKLYGIVHETNPDTLVYMHTDGCIWEIMPDLAECVKVLYLPEGGLGLNLEIGVDVPLENAEALLEAVEEYRHYKG